MKLSGIMRLSILAAMLLTSVPMHVDAQVFVYPRRPNQSNVRYFDFQWQHIDILVGSEVDPDKTEREFFGPHEPQSLHTHQHLLEHPATISHTMTQPGHHSNWLKNRRHDHDPGGYADTGDADDKNYQIEDSLSPSVDSQDRLNVTDSFVESTRLASQRYASMEAPDPRAGGVRLYFYEREREVAERAAAFIGQSYAYLIEQFDYVPTRTLPYILYNSYQEFLQTNLFPIQEGVLGVTSTRDLTLVLPYFGDHRQFQHVSTHEMVHQFTIQKVRDIARERELAADPLERIPLWYIEGIAEYYAHRGLDSETEMLARDLLLNPDPRRGYVMLDFFEDRPFSGLWTYKIGQVRCAFLEAEYGEGTLQRVLEASPLLIGTEDDDTALSFRGLLVSITGDDARTIAVKFETWLKRRVYTSYLKSLQDSPDVTPLSEVDGMVQTMSTSPDGYLMLYRSLSQSTGQARLYLKDVRNPRRARLVAGDGVPGVESLHPISGRTFGLSHDRLVFAARSKGRDVLYVQTFDHSATREDQESETNGSRWQIDLSLGARRSYDIGERGIMAAEAPSFSPDGRRIAFIGLDEVGQKDIFILEPLEDNDYLLTRMTHDTFAERGLSWGDQGIVYSSDATGHGFYNLFLLDPTNARQSTRLTEDRRDHFNPHVLPDGRVLFSAYDRGRANIYEVTDHGILQHTDIVTGLFDISSGPGSSIWALFHHRGQRHPVRMSQQRFLAATVDTIEDDMTVGVLPRHSLDDAEAYSARSLRNWQISNIFGVLGASGAGIYGQLVLLTSDRLRNHAILLNVLAFGSLERTDANLFYINQERRLIWGAGLFQDVRFRIDRSLPETDAFLSGERFYGARGTLRYPLNRFFYLQGDFGLGGVSYFLPEGSENFLTLQDQQENTRDDDHVGAWREMHNSARFQASPTLSLGYNTIRLHPGTGPLAGSSWLLETSLDYQPFYQELHGQVRLDAERYFPIYGRTNFSLRTGTGTTFGGQLARQFYLSSFDTLRGVRFADPDFLLGHHFHYTKAEIRFPLNVIVQVPILDIEGLFGADFGGVGDSFSDMWNRRVLAFVTGFNFGLGPLVFRLHFAKPFNIGAVRVPAGGDWITNFSLGWRYW